MGPVAWVREAEWFWQWPEPFVVLVPMDPGKQEERRGVKEKINVGKSIHATHCDRKCVHQPVEQLLRLGMDGEERSCCKDDLPAACDASAAVSEASDADGEPCFGGDSEPWTL